MKLKDYKWDILMLGGPWLLVVIAIIAGIIIIIASVGILSQENNTSNAPSPYGGTGEMTFAANVMTAKQIYNYIVKKNPEFAQDYQRIFDACQKFNVNPSFVIAIAETETSLGTNGTIGKVYKDVGGIRFSSEKQQVFASHGINSTNTNGWFTFSSYGDGEIADIILVRVEYLDKGITTMEQFFNKYSPQSDGNAAPEVRAANVRNLMRAIEATPKD